MRRQELHPRTVIINKKQKTQSKTAKKNALDWLIATFPHVFDTSLSIQPLKVGIMHDILAYSETVKDLFISRSKIREAVVLFTRRIDYLACLKAREMRIDLQGNPIACVSEEEAEKAALKIKKRVEKSARNARKTVVSKNLTPPSRSVPSSKSPAYSYNEAPNYYPERSTPALPAKVAPVITHKNTRPYDPLAVARLKEKLGLARKPESVDS